MQIDNIKNQEITEEFFKAYTKGFYKADSARLALERQTVTTLEIPTFHREKPTKLWFLAIPFTIIITLLIIYKILIYVLLYKNKRNKQTESTKKFSRIWKKITEWGLACKNYQWNRLLYRKRNKQHSLLLPHANSSNSKEKYFQWKRLKRRRKSGIMEGNF